jgi:hypothetical protein
MHAHVLDFLGKTLRLSILGSGDRDADECDVNYLPSYLLLRDVN